MSLLQLRDYSNKRRVLANVHLELAPGFTLEMRFSVKQTRSARDVKTDWMLEQLKYTLTHTSLLRANEPQPQSHVATFMHLRAPRATCGP
ncbi:hypothetical protein ALC57_14958 [Trachymyrmex cornetzi]|uniref:Uncharacterized protein n=1 Tax=Trachymyrmex cornetzi TaxID=471704 RepID=A0A195DJ27_9HYME|nr:hypothetical protein ALC57_14958 [Trachymyrmex cornetzi]